MKRLLRAWRDERGTATIETVLMLPLVLAFLALCVDLALIFNSRAEVLRVIQEANREMSIGRIGDTGSAEAYVTDNIDHLTDSANATSEVAAGVITTTVTMPASDLMMTGVFTKLLGVQLTLSAQQIIENQEV